ncbi:hypothetical protein WJX74_003955 [Apatococcus lobatus]|uniref:Molybdenum cofactor sulfurase n=1 Tax=Apatococcus lobatus TaxID=904363 RepID=A0AAW1QMJ2_9CHLO
MELFVLSPCIVFFLLGFAGGLLSLPRRLLQRLWTWRPVPSCLGYQKDQDFHMYSPSPAPSLTKAAAPAKAPSTMHAQPGKSVQLNMPAPPSQGCSGNNVTAEFPQLQGQIFLDHAGSTLASATQMAAAMQDMTHHLYTNPHSQHGLAEEGIGAAKAVQQARQLTLDMCQASAEDYEVIFTSGATGALKLVGEIMPWEAASQFVFTQDNHNSVLGIRNLAHAAGASSMAVTMQPSEGRWQAEPSNTGWMGPHHEQAEPAEEHWDFTWHTANLFAMPCESNFSGERYDPSIVTSVQQNGPWGPMHSAACSATQLRQYHGGPAACSQQCRQPDHPAGKQASADLSGSDQCRIQSPMHQSQSSRQPARPLQVAPEESVLKGPATLFTGGQRHNQQPCATTSCAEQSPGEVNEESCSTNAAGVCTPSVQQAGPGISAEQARGKQQDWYVLLDAAKACASKPPDLSTCPADFVAISYYKIFGYPTGLGALLVRRSVLAHMRKQYFGGGTVAASCAETAFFRRRPGAEGFEDGTAHFLGLAAVRHGFAQIASVGNFSAIHRHTDMLTRWLATELTNLQHGNGRPVCRLYGAQAIDSSASLHQPGSSELPQGACRGVIGQGPTVAFSVLQPDGSFVGHREVEKVAALSSILLRTGCFCNPGACALHLGMTPLDMQHNFEAGHACWDDMDLIAGRPTGAVRVSFGYMSTLGDAAAVVQMLCQYFVHSASQTHQAEASIPHRKCCSEAHASDPKRSAQSLQIPGKQPVKAAEAQPDLSPHPEQASASAQSSDVPSSHTSSAKESSVQSSCSSGVETLWPPDLYHMQSISSSSDRVSSSSDGSGKNESISCSKPESETFSDTDAASNASMQFPADSIPSHHQKSQTRLAASPAGLAAGGDHVPSNEEVRTAIVHDSSSLNFFQLAGSTSASAQDDSPMLFHDQAVAAAVPATGRASETSLAANVASGPRLGAMWIYPIKSCAGARVHAWPLCPTGLLYDRHWALVDADQRVLTQKRLPALARLYPWLDLEEGWIELRTNDASQPPLRMPLPEPQGSHRTSSAAATSDNPKGESSQMRIINICAEAACGKATVVTSGNSSEVAAWFRHAIGSECWLVQQHQESPRRASFAVHTQAETAISSGAKSRETAPGSQIGFANEGQLLLVNAASLADIDQRLSAKDKQPCADVSRFRPNLLVEGAPAFAEDGWTSVSIGSAMFHNAGPCTRCEMVCMDQRTGCKVGPEPLLTLASFRRINGRILFGILLTHQPSALPQQRRTEPLALESQSNQGCNADRMLQQASNSLSEGGVVPSKAIKNGLPTKQNQQDGSEHALFPVLRVGMPLLTGL